MRSVADVAPLGHSFAHVRAAVGLLGLCAGRGAISRAGTHKRNLPKIYTAYAQMKLGNTVSRDTPHFHDRQLTPPALGPSPCTSKIMAETSPTEVAAGTMEKGKKRWFPLESNPEVMNKYVAKMGWPTTAYRFTDVYSTEDWALAMVPQPVLGVVMLFPIKQSSELHKEEEAARLKSSTTDTSATKPYFMKQTVGNACGTIGLLHCTLNASVSKGISLDQESFLHRFWHRTRELSPAEIAKALHDENELEEVHEEAAQEGQSEQIPLEVKVNTHFVCLTEVNGTLFELDGRKDGPVPHGPTSPATLLQDACAVVKQFMDRDPGELRFTIVALAPATTEDA